MKTIAPFDFFIYALAVWRLAILLSVDTGPAKIFQKLRNFLKRESKIHPVLRKSDVQHGIECLRCSSVWVAIPVALCAMFPRSSVDDFLILVLALSGLAILFQRFSQPIAKK